MPKYRKKPVVLECYDFSLSKYDKEGTPLYDFYDGESYYINTLENQRYKMRLDDFVVFGIKGEKYPVKRDIFEGLYEKISEEIIEEISEECYPDLKPTAKRGATLRYKNQLKKQIAQLKRKKAMKLIS